MNIKIARYDPRFRGYRLRKMCKCEADDELVVIVMVTGQKQFRLQCLRCRTCGTLNLPHKALTDEEIVNARVFRVNNRQETLL